ncbi:uncharacterized protein LOC134272941 [Saccostrea cucullata]|uniref:uncharacterized protein LOC134272941 n=1 Tax=Saccostrea cuccullata TaxID=36930 RepID=UPI002ED40C10
MDPRYSAQEILLCDLCQTAALQSHCELCHVNLCIVCVGKHLSDSSKRHNVVPYKHRFTPSFLKCPNHIQKHCELYCEKCDIPVCSICISSGKHKGHDLSDALQKLNTKLKDLKKDLNELEKIIYPAYKAIESDLISEKVNLEKHYEKLTTAVTKHGEDWYRTIDIIVNKQKSEIDEMKAKHLAALNIKANEIKEITSDVKQSIFDVKKMLDSNDVSLTTAYTSRNDEFRNVPPKINISFPSFYSHHVMTEQLNQMFGSLSKLSITGEKQTYIMQTPEAVSCPSVKPLLDEPELITTIDTGYGLLYSVTSLRDEEIWTCGHDKIMKLYNLQGKLLKSMKTKSGNDPRNIAVAKSGELIYTDTGKRTVNILKNKQIQEVIRLQGWIPLYVCFTSSGDLLVTMDTDNKASAVVVVNQAGKFRFRYNAYGHLCTDKKSFDPRGITTDSKGQILTADYSNNCIHILDQDGQFLCYIYTCDLQFPWGLCVDTTDNLLVTECMRGKVKKIKYM